jgi:uncharacterized OB-fold protein
MDERIDDVSQIKNWKDSISFHYRYTTGLAGKRFFEAIIEGKVLASRCMRCKTIFLPPRIYCLKCYSKIEDFVELKGKGFVSAIAEKKVKGKILRYAFITFEGVTGGLIHTVKKGVGVGDRVKPLFVPKERRKGELSDIVTFVKA